MYYKLFLLVALYVINVSYAVDPVLREIDDLCFNYDDSCSSCIEQPDCQWCTKSINSSTGHHCFSHRSRFVKLCVDNENPSNSPVHIVENIHLTEAKNKQIEYKNIVQLMPQRVKISLRKGVPVNVTLKYRRVADYPLDLYYLMDLSKSMLPDKRRLASLGEELADTMRNLTNQFKIGFGSFVDKVMMPFVNVHPAMLRQPCSDIECATPFSFRNNLPLTEKDQEFTQKVANAQISSNLDTPEGGLDALMQTMVCDEDIGWRKNVRKIIVLSTDAPFKFAGDGKLAGVVRPNDEKCHLNEEGFYDQYDVYDYPSIGQIAEVAQEKGVNIIFAVKMKAGESKKANLYKELSQRIKGSAFGELSSKSSDIIKLVTDVYNSITSQVEITEKGRNQQSPISLRYFSACDSNVIRQTDSCSEVKEGNTFDFKVEVTLTDCPKKGERNTTVVVGTLQDSMQMDIEFLCDCHCENEKHESYQKNSAECSYKGTRKCDVCHCDGDNYGKKCQCSHKEISSEADRKSDRNKCRPEGSNSTIPVCSGRGRCECEICNCWNENYRGKFCQCNAALCRQDVDSDTECSGHGKCNCNECQCNPGWEGQFCECQNKQSCRPKGGDDFCSGNGECNCGRCECKVSYTGRYCEECPSCGVGKCLEFRPCVQCSMWESGELSEEECKECNYGKIQKIPSLDGPLSEYAKLCTFTDESSGCDFNFTYKYMYAEKGYTIYAQNRQQCPEEVDVLEVAFGVIVGVVALGIFTLIIWKLLTTFHDRREYSKFETESKSAVWNTDKNPLYQSATTTVANPGFSGQ